METNAISGEQLAAFTVTTVGIDIHRHLEELTESHGRNRPPSELTCASPVRSSLQLHLCWSVVGNNLYYHESDYIIVYQYCNCNPRMISTFKVLIKISTFTIIV